MPNMRIILADPNWSKPFRPAHFLQHFKVCHFGGSGSGIQCVGAFPRSVNGPCLLSSTAQ